jgi:hypothetical protein
LSLTQDDLTLAHNFFEGTVGFWQGHVSDNLYCGGAHQRYYGLKPGEPPYQAPSLYTSFGSYLNDQPFDGVTQVLAEYNPPILTFILYGENDLTKLGEEILLGRGYYRTGDSNKIRLYCPIACQDCEMQVICLFSSESERHTIARPTALKTVRDNLEGPIDFEF